MEWKDLSVTSRNIIERCWRFADDEPTYFTISHGELLYGVCVAEYHLQEVEAYQKLKPIFDFDRQGDTITVTGNCMFGSWLPARA